MHQSQVLFYWQFQPSKDWYLWTGLALGSTLAILLAWSNLRRTALHRGKPAHA